MSTVNNGNSENENNDTIGVHAENGAIEEVVDFEDEEDVDEEE